MSDKSKIEWTEATWNVVTGCSRVSEGCRNCYAERLAATRMAHVPAYDGLAEMTPGGPRWTGEVRFNADRLGLPLRWRRPRMIFVNSQSDLFHESLPFEQIAAIFGVMAACPQHTFQVLTKRPERAREWFGWVAAQPHGPTAWCWLKAAAYRETERMRRYMAETLWPLPNVWLGVSCEDQATADARIPLLLECPAAVRWVSAEPLLGPVDLRHLAPCDDFWTDALDTPDPARRVSWVVVGGESGPGARPMHPAWAEQIRDACVAAEVPFFFKQWGEWAPAAVVDDPRFSGGRAYDSPRGGRVTAMIRERSKRAFTPGVWQMMVPGDRTVGGVVMLDADTVAVQVGKKKAGRLLDGRIWDEMPTAKAMAL